MIFTMIMMKININILRAYRVVLKQLCYKNTYMIIFGKVIDIIVRRVEIERCLS